MIAFIIICTCIAMALGIYSVARGGMHGAAPTRVWPQEKSR